jgi:hypothetical protein
MDRRQLRLDATCWPQYAEREETRREHLLELRTYLGMEPFGLAHYRQAVHATTDLALQTDKGIVLASSVLDALRHQHIILPTLDVVERVCAEAITRANRRIYDSLAEPLSDAHRRRLDDLLKRRDNGKTLAGLAAPVPGQAELAAHARTHRTPQSGRRSTCLPASIGWFTRTGCSRSPARVAR